MLALYGHPFSSYTWKALIPLYENGTEFEFRALAPGDAAEAAFLKRSHPAGKFPVLVDGDTTVIETTAIVEYLAVHYPGAAPLIPAEPALAVTARMLDRVFDNYVMGNMQRVVAAYFVDRDNPGTGGLRDEPDPAEVEAGKAGLRRAYAWLEAWLSENALPPHVSLVSCAAAPSLFYADWVERIPGRLPSASPRCGPSCWLCLRSAAASRMPAPIAPTFRPARPIGIEPRTGRPRMADAPYELTVTRHIDAPPDLVWRVMIERQMEWWCPRPWRAEIVEHDCRAGGRSAMLFRGPEGEEMPQEGIFLEFTPGRRFVTTDAITADHRPSGPFMIGIWEIEPDGEGTLYKATARHWTEEAMKRHEEMGFAVGWGACAAQLAVLCEEVAKEEA